MIYAPLNTVGWPDWYLRKSYFSHKTSNPGSAPISDSHGDPWKPCVSNPENCTDSQMGMMNQYIDDYVAALNATTTFHANGNGAFIHRCACVANRPYGVSSHLLISLPHLRVSAC